MFVVRNHDAREVSDVADLLDSQVGLPECLVIRGLQLGCVQGHDCSENEGLHHVVVEVQPLSIKVLKDHS